MAATNAWNETSPAGTDLVSSLDNTIRAKLLDIRERMELEHYWNDDTTNDGKHINITIAGAGVIANKALLAASGGSLTGSNAQSWMSIAGTWNTTGTPTAVEVAITDTASNAASLLFNLLVGGVSKFKVGKDGAVTVSGVALITAAGKITSISSTYFADLPVVKTILVKTADTEVVSTDVETTVFTGTVPAGTLSTNRGIELTLVGNIENTGSGGTRNPVVTIKYGGTTVFTGILGSIADGANRCAWVLRFLLYAQGATNAQTAEVVSHVGKDDDAAGGALTAVETTRVGFKRGLAVDSTANQTLLVTVTPDLSSATFSIRVDSVRVTQIA